MAVTAGRCKSIASKSLWWKVGVTAMMTSGGSGPASVVWAGDPAGQGEGAIEIRWAQCLDVVFGPEIRLPGGISDSGGSGDVSHGRVTRSSSIHHNVQVSTLLGIQDALHNIVSQYLQNHTPFVESYEYLALLAPSKSSQTSCHTSRGSTTGSVRPVSMSPIPTARNMTARR